MSWIDMPYEIHALLYGLNGEPPQGHWVLMRWFKWGEESKYWDPDAKEAIGGPKWKYDDYAIRATYDIGSMSSVGIRRGSNTQIIPGQYDVNERMYIIERCYKPKIGDYIMEYPCDYPDEVDQFIAFAATNTPTMKYRFYHVEPVRVDNSQILYYLGYAKMDEGRD